MSGVKKIWLAVIAMLVLGAVAGLVWQWQADPAEWLVREDGSIVLTEQAARDKFGVIVVFVIAGAVASLVWGFAATFALRELGWRLTPLVIVTTLVAAVIAWRVGIELGPVGPAAAVDPEVGELLPSKLEIDGVTPFVVWPIFGVLGVLLSTWLSNDSSESSDALTGEPGHHG